MMQKRLIKKADGETTATRGTNLDVNAAQGLFNTAGLTAHAFVVHSPRPLVSLITDIHIDHCSLTITCLQGLAKSSKVPRSATRRLSNYYRREGMR